MNQLLFISRDWRLVHPRSDSTELAEAVPNKELNYFTDLIMPKIALFLKYVHHMYLFPEN